MESGSTSLSEIYSGVSYPLEMQHSSSSTCVGGSSVGNGLNGVGCIVHTVTKFDTLAGVAIKYGVEVVFNFHYVCRFMFDCLFNEFLEACGFIRVLCINYVY